MHGDLYKWNSIISVEVLGLCFSKWQCPAVGSWDSMMTHVSAGKLPDLKMSFLPVTQPLRLLLTALPPSLSGKSQSVTLHQPSRQATGITLNQVSDGSPPGAGEGGAVGLCAKAWRLQLPHSHCGPEASGPSHACLLQLGWTEPAGPSW